MMYVVDVFDPVKMDEEDEETVGLVAYSQSSV